MSNLAIKRINVDIKLYHKQELTKQGIYCYFNEENIYNVKVLIIGPDDTPYKGGFYLFDFNYPKNYPINPPKVEFISMDRRVRIHPNLYTNGKICLSFLGTWAGPGWTSCLNITTILLSILSLFNDNPISNEPGYENETGNKSILYKNMVSYHNISVYTLGVLENIPSDFKTFKPIIQKLFAKNYNNYYNQLKEHKEITYYKTNIYGLSTIVKYIEVKERLIDYLDYINTLTSFYNMANIPNNNATNASSTDTDVTNASSTDTDVTNISESATEATTDISKATTDNFNDFALITPPIETTATKTPINKRKAPNQKAKDYDVGFEMLSENSNKIYTVIITTNGYKRWVLKK